MSLSQCDVARPPGQNPGLRKGFGARAHAHDDDTLIVPEALSHPVVHGLPVTMQLGDHDDVGSVGVGRFERDEAVVRHHRQSTAEGDGGSRRGDEIGVERPRPREHLERREGVGDVGTV